MFASVHSALAQHKAAPAPDALVRSRLRRQRAKPSSDAFPPAFPVYVLFITIMAVVSAALPARAGDTGSQGAASQTSTFIQGKLEVADGAAKLASQTGTVSVSSSNSSLQNTLGDGRLNGREVRLEGERKPDGSFEARHLFTVRDGKLFRVRYYCHVCNIPATEPGNCVCCQRPTELDEIPADEVTDDMVMVP
jgi:hypothetical protein